MIRLTLDESHDLRRKGAALLALAESTQSQAERDSALATAKGYSVRLMLSGFRGLTGLDAAMRRATMTTPQAPPPHAPTAPTAASPAQPVTTRPSSPPAALQPATRPTATSPGRHTPDPTRPPPATCPRTLRRWQVDAMAALRASLTRKVKRPEDPSPRPTRPVIHAFMGAGKSIFLAELARLLCLKGQRVVVLTPKKKLVEQLGETFSAFVPNTGLYMSGYKQHEAQCVISCYPSATTLQAQYERDGTKVDVILVDEAHGSEGEQVKAAILGFNARFIIGVTATPFRADADEALTLFDEVVYRFSFQDGLRDGVVVPIQSINWNDTKHGPHLPKKIAKGELPNVDDAIIAMLKAEGIVGPTLTNASSIADATDYAQRLTEEGIAADCIHSRLSKAEQATRIEALRTGKIQVLVHVSMLSEGADFPWLRTLALRRQVASKTRFVQEVGRVLRVDSTNPEKVCGFVLDPAALLHKLGMDHEDAIGEALDKAAEEEAEDLSDKPEEDPEASPRDKQIPRAVRLKEIDAWMLSIIEQLRSKQAIPQRSLKYLPATIRDLCDNVHENPTEGQWNALDRWTQSKSNILRYMPCEASRDTIRAMVATRDLTKAQAGSLITILGWLAEVTQAHRSECHETKDYRRLYAWTWPTDLVRLPDPLTPPRQASLAAR